MKPKTTKQILAEDMMDMLNEASNRAILLQQLHDEEIKQKDKEYKRLEHDLKVSLAALVIVSLGLIFKVFYA